jgi:hypothetical protein
MPTTARSPNNALSKKSDTTDGGLGQGAQLPLTLGAHRGFEAPVKLTPRQAEPGASHDLTLSSSSTREAQRLRSPRVVESVPRIERLQNPTECLIIKHSLIALFQGGAGPVSREEYRAVNETREELFLLAARDYQRSRGEDLKGAGSPSLQVLRGVAATLKSHERAEFYLSLFDCLERQLEPGGARLHRAMLENEPLEMRRKVFDFARLSLGRGAEGARELVRSIAEVALNGENIGISQRTAVEALVESVHPIRGAATPAGFRDAAYNSNVKELLLRALGRPELGHQVIVALSSPSTRASIDIHGERDEARCRDALQSVLTFGTAEHMYHALRGMAVSGNLAMMTAALHTVLYEDTSRLPASFVRKTVSHLAFSSSSSSSDTSSERTDKVALLQALTRSVFSPSLSHENVAEILRAANTHSQQWGNECFTRDLLEREPSCARRVAFICSERSGEEGKSLRGELRTLLKGALLNSVVERQMRNLQRQGGVSREACEAIESIRKSLFSRAERIAVKLGLSLA